MDLGRLGSVINHTRFTAGYLAEVFESAVVVEGDITNRAETKHKTMPEIDPYDRNCTLSHITGIHKPAPVT